MQYRLEFDYSWIIRFEPMVYMGTWYVLTRFVPYPKPYGSSAPVVVLHLRLEWFVKFAGVERDILC